MWRPESVEQRRVTQVIALSVEPPIPRYLRNPRLGDWLSHSSAIGLLGITHCSQGHSDVQN